MARTARSGRASRRCLASLAIFALLVAAVPPGRAFAAGSPAPAGSPAAGSAAPAAARQDTKIIVTFRPGRSAAAQRAVKDAKGSITHRYTIIPGFSATVPEAALPGLRRNPNIAAIERDATVVAFENATLTGDLEYDNAWGVTRIGSYPVHQAGIRGEDIDVAVIDTGIDYVHDVPPSGEPPVVDPEFNGTYQGGWDFVNNDPDPMDDNGHGTHVAGILAADHNGYLVVGVAPKVRLWALKVLGASGSGDYSGLIAALDWAAAHGIDVVNISLGGHETSDALASAVHNAYQAGVTIVAASGNTVTLYEMIYGCPVAYPAAYPEAIAVTFTGQTDRLTGFSCTGSQVDLAAPGDQIFSPVPVGPCPLCSPYGYAAMSGTSMASPHVAGVAALVLSKGIADSNGDGLLADDVKAHLCATAATASYPAKTDSRYAKWYGCGIVDAEDALLTVPPPPPSSGGPAATADEVVTPEDTAVDADVLANDSDPNGDPLTVTALSTPGHGSANLNPGGTVHYLPAADYNGLDSFSYTVSDGQGNSATGTVSVTVTPVNDNPVAGPDTLVTSREVPSTLAVLANDADVDGDALSVAAVTAPAHGTVAIEADGSVTYSPALDYSGPDAFDYSVIDGAGGGATGHVAVTVVPVNHPPVAVADSAVTAEDTTISIDVVANDTDADGGALTPTAVTQPAHGSTALGAGGSVRYTPAPNYAGSDAFRYVVADGAGATATGDVSVTVTPVNDPPAAVDDTATTPEDTPITLVLAANDTDVDGDSLAVVEVGQPSMGNAVRGEGGTVVYTPEANAYGVDSFGYTVGDGAGGQATGTVTVTVTAVNDAPTADPKAVTTSYQTSVSITLTGADVETCDLGFEIVGQPANGMLTTPSSVLCVTLLPPYSDSSKVSYTPRAGFSGVDTFTYRTSDGSLLSPVATVTVTVRPAVELHVGDLDGSRTVQSSSWTARVTIRVDNAAHAAVSGATVTGTWSTGGTASCKTSSSGTCTVSKSKIPKTTRDVTFTVTGLATSTGTYVPSVNHDPDGDSTGTSIRITL